MKNKKIRNKIRYKDELNCWKFIRMLDFVQFNSRIKTELYQKYFEG